MTTAHRTLVRVTAALVILGSTVVVASASTSSAGAVAGASQADWQQAIANAPAPGGGCFSATYPAVAWRATPCAVAPSVPFIPATAARTTAQVVGNGNDYTAVVPGLITKATGAFANVSPGITEQGLAGTGTGPNIYSLQLNTQFFTTPACSGSTNPSGCLGWQQFIYDSAAKVIFMQYWLINYGTTCPATWTPNAGSCYVNSNAVKLAGKRLTVAQLATTRLSGFAARGGTDAVQLTNGGHANIVKGSDGVLTLASSWTTTEFGVFGDGGGSSATFSQNASLEATTTLHSTSGAAPTCVIQGFTAETNNLDLTATPSLGTVSFPTMGSAQTDGPSHPATCATAG